MSRVAAGQRGELVAVPTAMALGITPAAATHRMQKLLHIGLPEQTLLGHLSVPDHDFKATPTGTATARLPRGEAAAQAGRQARAAAAQRRCRRVAPVAERAAGAEELMRARRAPTDRAAPFMCLAMVPDIRSK